LALIEIALTEPAEARERHPGHIAHQEVILPTIVQHPDRAVIDQDHLLGQQHLEHLPTGTLEVALPAEGVTVPEEAAALEAAETTEAREAVVLEAVEV